RADPRRLGEEIAAAFLTVLRAEASHQPVMLILEDVHWADPASLRLLERALRELRDSPLFMVALARPLAEAPWAERAIHLPLRPLSRRACERLAIEVLGRDVAPQVLGRVVEQAAGNALFLEELIRAVAEGREDMPSTVLAILQSRIGGLAPE